jgi:hypothetical protein
MCRLRKQNGQSVMIFILMILILGGIIALAFDMGRAYLQKADMQSAADSAALAGARELPYTSQAAATALDYAARNGFTNGQDNVTITTYPHSEHANWYVVEIAKPAQHLLAPLIGRFTTPVSVYAVAEFNTYVPLDISGGGAYGANGVMTLSMFGPYGYYSYGDALSPRWLNNGSVNPDYKPNGYDFMVNVPSDYYTINGTNMMRVEVFDPDTWNNGGTDAYPGVRIDEIRSAPPSPHPQPSNVLNTTVYSLYAPDNTPNDFTDDVLVAQAVYGPQNGSLTDMKWVTPDGFEFPISEYGTGNYRLNMTATDGSSENGFNLRAGPPGGAFNPDNGTSVTANGALPINFNNSGTVTVNLGYVDALAAGQNMHINKFDTDVGAKYIQYACDSLGGTWAGTLSSDGAWREDIVQIPEAYSGGNWSATYYAGLQDTSVWTMWFEGAVEGMPGFVRLVK